MTPPLSIVIPSHRRADLLRFCLASVRRHAPTGTQVIVVDDGSPAGIVSRAAAEFPAVQVVRLPASHGFCTAANRGIAAATARVVEMLNDDTEVTPGWAAAALRWFERPEVGAVAPLVLQNDPVRRQRGLAPLIDTAGDEYHRGGYATKRGHGKPPGGDYARPQAVWGVSAAAGFYRRDLLLKVGGFPESFRAYFDDVDLSFRLRQAGGEIWFDPAAVVWHRVSASYGRRPSRRLLELQSRNEELVFWRNVRGQERRRQLLRHVGVIAAKGARRVQEGNLVPWLAGRLKAWQQVLTTPQAQDA